MAHREKWTTQSAPHTYRLGESQNEASRLTQTCVQRTGCGTSLALRNGIRVKVAAMTATTHNPSEEPCWVSRLRENFTSGSYGEELETGPAARSGTAPVPYPTNHVRQSHDQGLRAGGHAPDRPRQTLHLARAARLRLGAHRQNRRRHGALAPHSCQIGRAHV